jgi:DNA-binding NarL/FixJ family response regulator
VSDRVRLVIADDHAMVREGVRHVLAEVADFDIVAEVSDAQAVVDALRAHTPDVALLDLSMPHTTGVDIVERARSASAVTRIVVLSMHGDPATVSGALAAGATGYLLKDEAGPAELRGAVRAAAAGEAFFTPGIASVLAEAIQSPAASRRPPHRLDALSDREREVLEGIARGASNKQLAAQLGIGRRTVESHRESLMRKLGIHNVAGLTRFAIEAGLVPLDGP